MEPRNTIVVIQIVFGSFIIVNWSFLIYDYLEWEPQQHALRQPLLYHHFLSAFQYSFLWKNLYSHKFQHQFQKIFSSNVSICVASIE